jgi:hypothetical protein
VKKREKRREEIKENKESVTTKLKHKWRTCGREQAERPQLTEASEGGEVLDRKWPCCVMIVIVMVRVMVFVMMRVGKSSTGRGPA